MIAYGSHDIRTFLSTNLSQLTPLSSNSTHVSFSSPTFARSDWITAIHFLVLLLNAGQIVPKLATCRPWDSVFLNYQGELLAPLDRTCSFFFYLVRWILTVHVMMMRDGPWKEIYFFSSVVTSPFPRCMNFEPWGLNGGPQVTSPNLINEKFLYSK